MGDEFSNEPAVEISYPDIDSALTRYLGSDFCYTRREVDGSLVHILKKRKNDIWEDHLSIEDEEVKGFENDELATFLIHQVLSNRRSQRTTGIILLLMFVIGVPAMFYIFDLLGNPSLHTVPGIVIAVGIYFPFLPLCCLWSNYDDKSIDNQLYSIRSNFIDVLRKMKENAETETEKNILESRIQRLLDKFQTHPIE